MGGAYRFSNKIRKTPPKKIVNLYTRNCFVYLSIYAHISRLGETVWGIFCRISFSQNTRHFIRARGLLFILGRKKNPTRSLPDGQ